MSQCNGRVHDICTPILCTAAASKRRAWTKRILERCVPQLRCVTEHDARMRCVRSEITAADFSVVRYNPVRLIGVGGPAG